ncbi:hypothetical protein D3C87_1040780 [compost metagenome]
MPWTTPVTNWTIDRGIGVDDFNRIEGNVAVLGNTTGIYAGLTGGSGAAYTVSTPAITSIVEGTKVTIRLHTPNTGPATLNINGIGASVILKGNGNGLQPGNLKQNSIYTLVFNGVNFILQGEGGGGTAVANDIRAGKTAETDFGTVTGLLPVRAGGVVNPTGSNITKDAGIYDSPIVVAAVPVPTPALLEGNVVAGQAGTMYNRSARNHHTPGISVTVWQGDRLFVMPPDGYYNGASWVTTPVPGLVSNNVRSGVVIGDMTGSMGGVFPINFSGSWENGTTVEIFSIPAGWTNVAVAGLVSVRLSSISGFNSRVQLLLRDIQGNELLLSENSWGGEGSNWYDSSGMYIDRAARRITTEPDVSGAPDVHGGWQGITDIGMNGTFSKPFNMDNRITLLYRVVAVVNPGYSSAYVIGNVVYI